MREMSDIIAELKTTRNGANTGPYELTQTYGALVSETHLEGDHPQYAEKDRVDFFGRIPYEGKTLIAESIQRHNSEYLLGVVTHVPTLVDAVETLMETLVGLGVSREHVNALALARRRGGMK